MFTISFDPWLLPFLAITAWLLIFVGIPSLMDAGACAADPEGRGGAYVSKFILCVVAVLIAIAIAWICWGAGPVARGIGLALAIAIGWWARRLRRRTRYAANGD